MAEPPRRRNGRTLTAEGKGKQQSGCQRRKRGIGRNKVSALSTGLKSKAIVKIEGTALPSRRDQNSQLLEGTCTEEAKAGLWSRYKLLEKGFPQHKMTVPQLFRADSP
jgi:hypothetical protein